MRVAPWHRLRRKPRSLSDWRHPPELLNQSRNSPRPTASTMATTSPSGLRNHHSGTTCLNSSKKPKTRIARPTR